jgi:N-acetylglucosamine repressor
MRYCSLFRPGVKRGVFRPPALDDAGRLRYTPAGMRISDHASMKRNNQLAILRCIRDRGPISRVDLKHMTKLSWGTITASTRELLSGGILMEIGAVTTGLGRRPVELELNRGRNLVLGMQLGSSLVRAVLMDVKGSVVGELDMPVDAEGSSASILGRMIDTGRRILQRHGVERSTLAGIGIAAPGAVDFESGVCLYAPHHPNWKNVRLKDRIERAFGVPCCVDHAYNCFALSEKLFGFGRELDSFVCVLLGTGVSAGIVLGGEVYRGANSLAGEFGHTCVDENGPLCACGNTGCIEMYVSGPALASAAQRETGRSGQADGSRLTAESLSHAARKGDAIARRVYARMGTVLGIGISSLINIFNPQAVILGGLVCRASDLFLPSCMETVRRRAWHASPKDVKVSHLERGAVLGAAALVLQQLFTTGRILDRAVAGARRRAGRASSMAGANRS